MTALEAKRAWRDIGSKWVVNSWLCVVLLVCSTVFLLVLLVFSNMDTWISVRLAFGGACVAGLFLLYREVCFRKNYHSNSKLRVFCEHCAKFIEQWGWAWRCGYCNKINECYINSFLHRCKHCGQSPHAITCPHCEKLNYLDELQVDRNPAEAADRKPPVPIPQPTPDDLHEQDVTVLQRKKQLTTLNTELAVEEARLERIRKARVPATEKPFAVQAQENFEKYRDKQLAVHMTAKRALDNPPEELKHDPDGLEKYRLMVEQWRQDNLE